MFVNRISLKHNNSKFQQKIKIVLENAKALMDEKGKYKFIFHDLHIPQHYSFIKLH